MTTGIEYRALPAALAAAVLCGCTSTTPLTRPEQTDSVIEFTRKLQVETSALLDVTLAKVKVSVVEPERLDGYSTYAMYWCARHAEAVGAPGITRQYRKFCEAKGGEFRAPMCRDRSDPDAVLFYAEVKNDRHCTNAPDHSVDVLLVEPTAGSANPDYVEKLRSLGYRTRADIAAAADAEARRMQRAADQRHLMLPRMRKIGARICREESGRLGPVRYVGYVENLADEKIQIRVAQAHLAKAPSVAPGGFQPSVIWDYPANWVLCE